MEFSISLTADRSVVREALKGMKIPNFTQKTHLTPGIVWTIFFSRLFGPITPVTNEFMDVAYPMAADLPDLDALIDTRIDELIKRDFAASTTQPRVGQLVVQFFDATTTKTKKKSGWFGHVTEIRSLDQPWESWVINVNCLPIGSELPVPGDQLLNPAERTLQLSLQSFEKALAEVMDLVDQHRSHIPPIVTLDVLPFPYEIRIDPEEVHQPPPADDESWATYIKKLLE